MDYTRYLQTEQRGQIAIITINRPDRLNALSAGLLDALERILRSPPIQDSRVIILKGAGNAFSAGLDLHTAKLEGFTVLVQEKFSSIITTMRSIPQPIICAVVGPAAGAGMSLALAADIRVASKDAYFLASFTGLGLSACELGLSYFLPKAIGPSNTALYLMTRSKITADEAYRMGLVSMVTENPFSTALEIAEKMIQNVSQIGLILTKKSLNSVSDGQSLVGALHTENVTQVLCLSTPEAQQYALEYVKKFQKNSKL